MDKITVFKKNLSKAARLPKAVAQQMMSNT